MKYLAVNKIPELVYYNVVILYTYEDILYPISDIWQYNFYDICFAQ